MTVKTKGQGTFASDAMYNTLGTIVYFVCLWVVSVIVVRLSGYEDAGILSVAMTTANIFFVVANYGMRSFQATDVTNEYSNKQYVLSRYITVFISVVLCILFAIICGYRGQQFSAILLFMLYKAVEALADVLFGVLQRTHRLKKAGISLIWKGLLSAASFIICLYVSGNLILSLTLMFVSVLAVMLFFDFPQTLTVDNDIFKYTREDLRKAVQLLKSCFAMFLVSIAPMVMQAIPKLIFERLYTTEEMGVYASVAAPTVVIPTMVSCIMIPFLPLFADAIQNNDKKRLLKLVLSFTGLVLGIGVFACILAVFFGEWALTLLYGPELIGYTNLLLWVICSVILACLLYCLNSMFISGRKLPLLSVVYVVADIVCAIIAVPLIKCRGIYGIADTLNLTQLFQCVVLIVLCIPLFFCGKQKK